MTRYTHKGTGNGKSSKMKMYFIYTEIGYDEIVMLLVSVWFASILIFIHHCSYHTVC